MLAFIVSYLLSNQELTKKITNGAHSSVVPNYSKSDNCSGTACFLPAAYCCRQKQKLTSLQQNCQIFTLAQVAGSRRQRMPALQWRFSLQVISIVFALIQNGLNYYLHFYQLPQMTP
jgi:hypothetical protein